MLDDTDVDCGFVVLKRGRSMPRVADVQPGCCAHLHGLRDFYLLTYLNGADARNMTLADIDHTLATTRPLRISWEHDGHIVEADTTARTSAAVQDAQQRTHRRRMERNLADDRAQRRRRIAEGDATNDDITQHLIELHPRRATTLKARHMRLRTGNCCEHCGFVPLQVEQLLKRDKCCFRGACFDYTFLPRLEPWPRRLIQLAVENVKVLSHHSLELNQSLNVAVMSLEPTRDAGGGGLVQRIPHQRVQTISLSGRLYRYLRPGNHVSTPAKYVMHYVTDHVMRILHFYYQSILLYTIN